MSTNNNEEIELEQFLEHINLKILINNFLNTEARVEKKRTKKEKNSVKAADLSLYKQIYKKIETDILDEKGHILEKELLTKVEKEVKYKSLMNDLKNVRMLILDTCIISFCIGMIVNQITNRLNLSTISDSLILICIMLIIIVCVFVLSLSGEIKKIIEFEKDGN